MRRTALIMSASLMIATVALAHNGVQNPAVMARMQGMEQLGAASKVLGNMARGRVAFDAEAAAAAKAALVQHASEIPALFEAQEDDPKSEARAEIWEDFAGFTENANALKDAAEALDITNADTIGSGMGAIGGTCRSCHRSYRQ
ncbi:cytochrome c [Cognatishimia sp.]|uniref:c-type cytochrome n=1 Tax=Cognatishimia sp. TaxID=2211648 RepID=UPI003514F830